MAIDRLLRRPAVEAITGLSRSGIYELMARGDFPRPMRIGPRAVAWRESDIQEWIGCLRPAGELRPGACEAARLVAHQEGSRGADSARASL